MGVYGVLGVLFIDDDKLEAEWSLAFQGRKHVASGEITALRVHGFELLIYDFRLVL